MCGVKLGQRHFDPLRRPFTWRNNVLNSVRTETLSKLTNSMFFVHLWQDHEHTDVTARVWEFYDVRAQLAGVHYTNRVIDIIKCCLQYHCQMKDIRGVMVFLFIYFHVGRGILYKKIINICKNKPHWEIGSFLKYILVVKNNLKWLN